MSTDAAPTFVTLPAIPHADRGGPLHSYSSQHADGTWVECFGASMLDYFMAHAPEAPWWFTPIMPPLLLGDFEGSPARCTVMTSERVLQWPRYWAERMLVERAKPMTNSGAAASAVTSAEAQTREVQPSHSV